MPAPTTGSRHLYTGHHQDGMQSASWLRACPEGKPLSREFRPPPVLMSAFYGFDASAVVHTCSSSRRTPCPAPGGTFPYRSRPRLLTSAAYGGLGPPTARRSRRAYLHHWHSTVHVSDLLHRFHSPFRTHAGTRRRSPGSPPRRRRSAPPPTARWRILSSSAGDAERALPPVRLRDVHPPRRARPVGAPVDPVVQVPEVRPQILPVGVPRHPVHTRRSLRADRHVSRPQASPGRRGAAAR